MVSLNSIVCIVESFSCDFLETYNPIYSCDTIGCSISHVDDNWRGGGFELRMKGDFGSSDEFVEIYVNDVLVDTCNVGNVECGDYVDCGTFHGDVGYLSVRVQSSTAVDPLCNGLSMQVQFLLQASHGSKQPKYLFTNKYIIKHFCIVILLETKLYQIQL